MKKKVNILLSVFSFLVFGCTPSSAHSKKNQIPTTSFVKIINTTTIKSCKKNYKEKCPVGSYSSSGSGVSIKLSKNKKTVLTAGHVCDTRPAEHFKETLQSVQVIDHNNIVHQAWPIAVSLNDSKGAPDACILWVPTLNVPRVDISRSKPSIGDELIYMGAPAGVYHPPTVPIFKGIYSGPLDASSSVVTFPATGGSSGGPVLDKDNKIVGIVFAANRAFHHITLITSYDSLLVFLESAKKKINTKLQ